jgi:hypothetical protein
MQGTADRVEFPTSTSVDRRAVIGYRGRAVATDR